MIRPTRAAGAADGLPAQPRARRRAPRRLAILLAVVVGALAATVTVAGPAGASDNSALGCTVHSGVPSKVGTTLHYSGAVTCDQVKLVTMTRMYIQNEYFKPGATNSSWDGHRYHDCGDQPGFCHVTSTGPWKGHGKYCTVTSVFLYPWARSISDRYCATY